MLKAQSFSTENIYFWSDLHLNHDRDFIYGPRGFTNVLDHNKTLYNRFKDKVNADATVFLLGDTMFGNHAAEGLESLFGFLPGKEFYIMPGNHFSGLKELKNKYGWNFEYAGKRINFIPNLYEIYVKEQYMVLSHYPILSWNKMGKGAWMVHGHTHGKILQTLPKGQGYGKILDVGVESTPEPMSFKEIGEIMANKVRSKIDHH